MNTRGIAVYPRGGYSQRRLLSKPDTGTVPQYLELVCVTDTFGFDSPPVRRSPSSAIALSAFVAIRFGVVRCGAPTRDSRRAFFFYHASGSNGNLVCTATQHRTEQVLQRRIHLWSAALVQRMATDLEVGKPNAHAPPEVAADLDSKQEEPGAPAAATTAPQQDPAQRVAATADDAADGTNGVTPGDEMVVDEVSSASLYITGWCSAQKQTSKQKDPVSRLTSCSMVLRGLVR